MKSWQKTVKYIAIAFAVVLICGIFAGIFGILGAVNFVNGIGSKMTEAPLLVENAVFSVSDKAMNLDVELGVVKFSVKTDVMFRVETNLDNIIVTEYGNKLKIEEKNVYKNYPSGAFVALYVPENFVFEEVEINAGAGNVAIEKIYAADIDFDLGAGMLEIGYLSSARKTEISGGVGDIVIKNANLNNPNITTGVGEFVFNGGITGFASFELGVGNADITVSGDKDDYTVDVSKGLGLVYVDGSNVDDSTVIGDGVNTLNVSGGIGKIKITFNG